MWRACTSGTRRSNVDFTQDIWNQVGKHMSVPHLMKVAATSRIFGEALGESVRTAINRCLDLAEAHHGSEFLARLGPMTSLAVCGLNPWTLQHVGNAVFEVLKLLGPMGRRCWLSVYPQGADPPHEPVDITGFLYTVRLENGYHVNKLLDALNIRSRGCKIYAR